MMMLKEWSSVVGALESGEQSVLLRKGGILEVSSGFRIESRRFWLYPTWEHQNAQNIRAEYHRHMSGERPPPDTNVLSSYADVIREADLDSAEAVQSLEPFHIWSRSYVESRRRWDPHRPLKAVLLRVYKAPPVTIPIISEYGGCKSWLDFDTAPQGGRPVMSDERAAGVAARFGEAIR